MVASVVPVPEVESPDAAPPVVPLSEVVPLVAPPLVAPPVPFEEFEESPVVDELSVLVPVPASVEVPDDVPLLSVVPSAVPDVFVWSVACA